MGAPGKAELNKGNWLESDHIQSSAVTTAKIADEAVTEAKLLNADTDGLHPVRIARATYDFDVDGGDVGDIGLGVTLPPNAIITRAYYEVITTCTSDSDAATIAIGLPSDDAAGIVAATAISAGSNIWDDGYHECIQDGTASNFSEKTTASRELTVTIGVEAVEAGKFILFCEYVVSDTDPA